MVTPFVAPLSSELHLHQWNTSCTIYSKFARHTSPQGHKEISPYCSVDCGLSSLFRYFIMIWWLLLVCNFCYYIETVGCIFAGSLLQQLITWLQGGTIYTYCAYPLVICYYRYIIELYYMYPLRYFSFITNNLGCNSVDQTIVWATPYSIRVS